MRLPTMCLHRFAIRLILCLFLSWGFQACKEKQHQHSKEESGSIPDSMEGFIPIFDGKSLDGWEGDPTYWHAEKGLLIGEVTPETHLESNTFIIWQGGQPADFELKLEFRITEAGNSGINYRSERLDTIPFALKGYQADIDGKNTYTGQNYEERKRTTLAYRGEKVVVKSQENSFERGSLRANVKNNAWQNREVQASLGNSDSLKSKIKAEGWNSSHIIVKDNHLQHYVNRILMSEVTDLDSLNRKASGFLGLQVHVGPPMKVEFRNIKLKEY